MSDISKRIKTDGSAVAAGISSPASQTKVGRYEVIPIANIVFGDVKDITNDRVVAEFFDGGKFEDGQWVANYIGRADADLADQVVYIAFAQILNVQWEASHVE